MDTLKIRFFQITGAFIGLLIAAALLWSDKVPSFIYPILFAIWGLLYTKLLWKLFSPNLNLDGKWWGYTDYKYIERHINGNVPKLPIRKPHFVKFKQDPFMLSIENSEGESMVSWRAEAVALYPEGRIVMAYHVIRQQENEGFPKETKGYEEIRVMERNWYGTPVKLKGHFYHAAEPGKNLYSGETIYFRKKIPADINKMIIKE